MTIKELRAQKKYPGEIEVERLRAEVAELRADNERLYAITMPTKDLAEAKARLVQILAQISRLSEPTLPFWNLAQEALGLVDQFTQATFVVERQLKEALANERAMREHAVDVQILYMRRLEKAEKELSDIDLALEAACADTPRGQCVARWIEIAHDAEVKLKEYEAYQQANPLGGPAVIFESMASRVRAGEDFYAVLKDCGFQEIPKL